MRHERPVRKPKPEIQSHAAGSEFQLPHTKPNQSKSLIMLLLLVSTARQILLIAGCTHTHPVQEYTAAQRGIKWLSILGSLAVAPHAPLPPCTPTSPSPSRSRPQHHRTTNNSSGSGRPSQIAFASVCHGNTVSLSLTNH